MQLLSSLLFGISASLDALLVGISYGLRKIRIRALQNLAISFVSLLGTCLSAFMGSHLLPFLPSVLADCTGSVILMLLGAYYIVKWLLTVLKKRRAQTAAEMQITAGTQTTTGVQTAVKMQTTAELPAAAEMQAADQEETAPEQPRSSLSPWETLILSLTLSVNNIGIGLSASMAGLRLIPAAATTFGCSALFLLCGNRLGQSRFLCLVGHAADPISGLLLIGLGLLQLTI